MINNTKKFEHGMQARAHSPILKRLFIMLSFIIFCFVFEKFINGEYGLRKYLQLNSEKKEIQSKLLENKNENIMLIYQIKQLKDDINYIEYLARKNLGMMKPNEVEYIFTSREKSNKSYYKILPK